MTNSTLKVEFCILGQCHWLCSVNPDNLLSLHVTHLPAHLWDDNKKLHIATCCQAQCSNGGLINEHKTKPTYLTNSRPQAPFKQKYANSIGFMTKHEINKVVTGST